MNKEEFIKIIGKYPKNPLGEPPRGLTFTEMISDINILAAAVEACQENRRIDGMHNSAIRDQVADLEAELVEAKAILDDLAPYLRAQGVPYKEQVADLRKQLAENKRFRHMNGFTPDASRDK